MTVSRILLLGKSGQVGSALHARLASRGHIFAPGRETCDLVNVDKLSDVIRSVQPTIISAAAYTASAEFIAEVTARIVDSCGRDAGPNAGKEGRGTFNLAPSGTGSFRSRLSSIARRPRVPKIRCSIRAKSAKHSIWIFPPGRCI